MDVLTQVAQFILSLSILIVLHELGHFIPAKLFKTKVEKFYLFFDPWFSLFKIKRGETEYGIGWLPLGGYVKISGMIDESMDKEQMKQPPKDWEFRSKPAWQRLIIMVGGVTVNVILGILIYAMVLFVWGEEYLPAKNIKYGMAVDSLGYQIGLRDGDKVVNIDSLPVENITSLSTEIALKLAKTIRVERGGEILTFKITEDNLSSIISQKSTVATPRFPFEIDSVADKSPAKMVGVLKNDSIISVNKTPTPFYQDAIRIFKQNKNSTVEIRILRNSDTITINPKLTAEGTLGVWPKPLNNYFELETKQYDFLASFPAGIHKAYDTFDKYIQQMKVLFTVKGAHKEIGGFLSIGKAYSTTWNWERFWAFTAFLSIVLAIMNILPIPALDGGHVMFLLYEVITRRKPNEKVMEYAQYAGMILLLALLLYANGNDIIRLFSK